MNEAGNAANLAREIASVLDGRSLRDDLRRRRSRDDTRAELAALKAELPALRLLRPPLRTPAKAGPCARACWPPARRSWARWMATARTIRPTCQALLAKITRADAPADLGMVAGKRTKRQDNWSKRTASRIANNPSARAALKDGADDSGSGIKVFKREAFLRLPYFDHMHRFMAALMLREGYAVEFLEVNHRQRGAGRSKYTNLGRLAANMTDLWGVMWLRSRARLPGGADEL
jgi:dolichol-phosphate mannosyltransferase